MPTEAGVIVAERVNQLQTYAEKTFNIVQQQIAEITSLIKNLPNNNTDINIKNVDIPNINYGGRPSLGKVNLPTNWPSNNTRGLNFISLPPLDIPNFPVFNIQEPTYNIPDAPAMSNIPPPGDMEPINPINIPTAPSISLPNPPKIQDVVLPSPPDIKIPDFTATLPKYSIQEPGRFTWGDINYQSDIWSDLLKKVLNDIRNGGTGLNVEVENDLYQRYLDRTFAENERMYNEAMNYWSARGFTFPPGMLAGAINEINQQISRNNINASRDITINQAELAQKNTQFIIEIGTKLEGMLREFYISNANRVLEAAKYTADNMLAIFDAKIKAVNLDIEAYKSQAMVYESQVKAALTSVEIFKSQIEGARVSVETQKSLVDIYNSQVAASETLMKLYVSEMEGAKIASDIEMTKIEKFKALIQSYISRVEAEKNKVLLYESIIKGETSKAELYKARVEAFNVEVDSYVKKLDAQLKESEVILNQNRTEVERYKAELSAYETEVRAKASEISSIVSGFTAEAQAYQAETGVQEVYYKTKIEEIRTQIANAELNLKKAVSQIEAAIKEYEIVNNLKLKGSEVIMNVGAQITASALNAIHASAAIGYNASDSFSNSHNTSEMNSISEVHEFIQST